MGVSRKVLHISDTPFHLGTKNYIGRGVESANTQVRSTADEINHPPRTFHVSRTVLWPSPNPVRRGFHKALCVLSSINFATESYSSTGP